MMRFIVFAMMWAILFGSWSVTANELTAREKTILVVAIKHDLRDPESAHFRWMKLPGKINPQHFVTQYCGLVNAKNGYGGYTGFEPFLALVARENGKFEVISITMSSKDLTNDAIAEMCADEGFKDFSLAK